MENWGIKKIENVCRDAGMGVEKREISVGMHGIDMGIAYFPISF